jgi:hypothetical protein
MLIRRLATALVIAAAGTLAGCKCCGSGATSNCSPAVCGATPIPACNNCGGPGRPPVVVSPPPPPGQVGPPPGTSYYPQSQSSFERKL